MGIDRGFIPTRGLNPFEIRGGLKRSPPPSSIELPGLNPFEIRGGLKLCAGRATARVTAS